MHFILLS